MVQADRAENEVRTSGSYQGASGFGFDFDYSQCSVEVQRCQVFQNHFLKNVFLNFLLNNIESEGGGGGDFGIIQSVALIPDCGSDWDLESGIQEIRYIRITGLYKTYCELFLRDWNSRSGMCEFRYNRVRYESNWLVFCILLPKPTKILQAHTATWNVYSTGSWIRKIRCWWIFTRESSRNGLMIQWSDRPVPMFCHKMSFKIKICNDIILRILWKKVWNCWNFCEEKGLNWTSLLGVVEKMDSWKKSRSGSYWIFWPFDWRMRVFSTPLIGYVPCFAVQKWSHSQEIF